MVFRGGGRGIVASWSSMLVRHFSKKRSVDPRRINPKVPREEAKAISNSLYEFIKQHGPISVSNTWNLVKEAGVSGLNSKTHMKIMLKWMRGRKMLKLFCTHHGSTKRFLHSTLPEEQLPTPSEVPQETPPEAPKSLKHPKKQYKKLLGPDME